MGAGRVVGQLGYGRGASRPSPCRPAIRRLASPAERRGGETSRRNAATPDDASQDSAETPDDPGADGEDRAEPSQRIHARPITLSAPRLGLIARLDLVEGEGDSVTPVDYKRGKRPHVPRGAYDPERVQLCVQGMILEENGYTCNEGVLYFAEGRERVRVDFDDELRALTRNAIHGLRLMASGGRSRRHWWIAPSARAARSSAFVCRTSSTTLVAAHSGHDGHLIR
jgi:hypothetical protein